MVNQLYCCMVIRFASEDVAYQTFRRQVRSPEWQAQFSSLPLSQRRDMARQARHLSQHYTQQQDAP
jgi:UDP-2,3-diacylglucosamine hydrolase